jgi:hypothetical protein
MLAFQVLRAIVDGESEGLVAGIAGIGRMPTLQ